MDKDIETMVAEIEARAAKATPGPWDDLRIGSLGNGSARSAEEQLCNSNGVAVVILTHDGSVEAIDNVDFVRHAREDVPRLCAMWREAIAERDALRERLRIIQSTDDGNLDAKAQTLADLFAGKNIDGCIATEDEIIAVRKTLSIRAKERQASAERIANLTDMLERVRDLESVNDLLDLMPMIVAIVGPNPALVSPTLPPTQP